MSEGGEGLLRPDEEHPYCASGHVAMAKWVKQEGQGQMMPSANSTTRLALAAAAAALLAGCGAQGGSGGPRAPAAFGTCLSCHSHEAGAAARIGPNLYGVLGRRAGSAPGYNYSEALRTSGIVWDRASLDAFLQNPRAYVPGTRMPISVTDPGQRQAIIAFLAKDRK